MATSSITDGIFIKDAETAEKFINAIDKEKSMLDLNGAIAHCEEKAEELKKKAETNIIENDKNGTIMVYDEKEYTDCLECAREHAQLAAWLKELQVYRDADDGDIISRKALLERIDKEREYLKARGLFGAEHVLVHNFRGLVEEAQPTTSFGIYAAGYHAGFYAVHGEPEKPEGEWIATDETDEFYGRVYRCTHCSEETLACGCRNFCPNCGAKMRLKKDN